MRQYNTRDLDINFSISSSHLEVFEGEVFTITLIISGPDAKSGLQIPFRIIGSCNISDYIPNQEYGLFTINDDLTASVSFKAKLDEINESNSTFIIALYYYSNISKIVTIKNTPASPSTRPPEPTPNPPTFQIIKYDNEITGGTEAIFHIITTNMRSGVKLYYFVQSNLDQYPTEEYVYSESSGISVIKISTDSTPVRRLLRVWLKNHPKIQNQIFIAPPTTED